MNTRVKTLRSNQTEAEKLLWRHIRNRQLDNHKFRRQHPVGKFVADFACLEKKLIVELDGGQHSVGQYKDSQRTADLAKTGYAVIRFWNNKVLNNINGALQALTLTLSQREREFHRKETP